MSYSSIVDIKNYIPETVIIQLSDDGDVDEINVEKLNDCIRRADNRIDTACLGRFPVPVQPPIPDMIRDLSVKLAVYFLYQRSLVATLPEPIKLEYQDAMKILGDIQKGRLSPFPLAQNPVWAVSNKTGTVPLTEQSATNNRSFDRYFI